MKNVHTQKGMFNRASHCSHSKTVSLKSCGIGGPPHPPPLENHKFYRFLYKLAFRPYLKKFLMLRLDSISCNKLPTVNTKYSKTCVKWPLKNSQSKCLMTNGSLMQVKSIAECSPFDLHIIL